MGAKVKMTVMCKSRSVIVKSNRSYPLGARGSKWQGGPGGGMPGPCGCGAWPRKKG